MGELGVHWEAAPPPRSPEGAVAQWEVIRRMHLNKGYADIAYNFGVTDFGQILIGRGWDTQTAANGPGYNAGNRAVCWLGGPGYSPTAQAYEAAAQVIHDGMARGFTVVRPHSSYVATQCPGDDWRAWVARQGWTTTTPTPPSDGDEFYPEDDTMLIIKRSSGQAAILCGAHRPRLIESINDYQRGTFVTLEDEAWDQYWNDALALYAAATK